MHHIVTRLLKSYLYSNIHIGLCAGFFAIQYTNAFEENTSLSTIAYFGFISCATITLYCVHRFIGYQALLRRGEISGRYVDIESIIPSYPMLIMFFGVSTIYFAWSIGISQLYGIVVPIGLSALYVLPILPGRKRLRDLPYIKIFIIALNWVWFATWHLKVDSYQLYFLMVIEATCYMLAITIPFDIRDKAIDEADSVKTLVTHFGSKTANRLVYILLLVSLTLTYLIGFQVGTSSFTYLLYSGLYFLLFYITTNYNSTKSDVILTGLVDGSLMAKGLLGFYLLSHI